MALARALERDAKSTEERSFLMAELALELARVSPAEAPGYLTKSRVREVLLKTAHELCKRGDLQPDSAHKNLQMYLSKVYDHVTSHMAGA
jgi:hypothetical protein